MKISVQNLSSSLSDKQVEHIVVALRAQAMSDYNGSGWVTGSLAEAAESVVFVSVHAKPPADTAHLEVLDTSDEPGAIGYHEEQPFRRHTAAGKPEKSSARSERGLRSDQPHLPLMRVFAKTARLDGVSVAEVASHEILEALVDPRPMVTPYMATNERQGRDYIVEVGDPVQETPYALEGEMVANFAEPGWFGLGKPGRYDFLGVLSNPFELTAGGYISFTPIGEPEAWQQEGGPSEGEPVESSGTGADDADRALWAANEAWAMETVHRHRGENRKAAFAFREWAISKGFIE